MNPVPTATAFFDNLARNRAAEAGYTGPLSRTLPADWKAEAPAKKKPTRDGYGRRRYRCDIDGAGRSEDHTGNGRLCGDHPDAKSHRWDLGGGMAEAEAWIVDMMRGGIRDIPARIERFDPFGDDKGWTTTQGEVAMCYALLSRWGRLSATVEAF